jgi:hypothetical protein
VCHRTVSGAPPDSVRCTRDPNSELLTFENSGDQSGIIHRTVRCRTGQCPVCQRSNGFFRANGHLQWHLMRARARRSQARARRRTRQSTGPVRCTTGLSGGPEDFSSNGSVTWQAHRTVRCAMRQTASQRPLLVVGAINTPTTPHSIASKFSDFPHLTRAIAFNTRHNKEIKSSPKSLVHSKSNSDLCSFELLCLDCFFFSFFLVINSIVTEARDTNCVVVLEGTLCPV